jgi:hypothetical protein
MSFAFLVFSSSHPLIVIIKAAYTKDQTAIKPKNHAIFLIQIRILSLNFQEPISTFQGSTNLSPSPQLARLFALVNSES